MTTDHTPDRRPHGPEQHAPDEHPRDPATPAAGRGPGKRGVLDAIEWVGNKLPDPAALFLIGWIFVIAMSAVAATVGWSVEGTVIDRDTGVASIETITANNLLTSDGLYAAISGLVDNFINFPPLGIVLVGMLGVGVAERTGLLAILLKISMLIVPKFALTPAVVFLGVMSSLASDAGYIVLPPLAALLYASVGRSPLVGIAAAFAGVSAGFNANLVVTSLDPMLAEFTNVGATTVDPEYNVEATANWAFMIASTFMATLVGWATTAFLVERRLTRKPADQGGPVPHDDPRIAGASDKPTTAEYRNAGIAVAAGALTLAGILCLILIPGAPLNGLDNPDNPNSAQRWVTSIVPLILIGFLMPGLAYGVVTKTVKSSKDAAKLMIESMASMGPIIVLAFFAGQFIAAFNDSNLGTMLAMSGGNALVEAQLSPYLLIVLFIAITAVFNIFVGSMSAKYALFAPIFVPMLMVVGISPELTQVAYRIGDSVTNIITPLNSYVIIILVFVQKWVPKAGIGTLVSMMLPYSVVFAIAWTVMLLIWMAGGWSLGIPAEDGPLWYEPAAALP